MVQKNVRIVWGLFVLRLGLGIFLAMWSLDKMIAPDTTVMEFAKYYLIDIRPSLALIIGAIELVLSLFFLLGVYKTITYGAGLLLHAFNTISRFQEFVFPFGNNHLYISFIGLLFGFLALFLLRNYDTKLTLGKKKSLFA